MERKRITKYLEILTQSDSIQSWEICSVFTSPWLKTVCVEVCISGLHGALGVSIAFVVVLFMENSFVLDTQDLIACYYLEPKS